MHMVVDEDTTIEGLLGLQKGVFILGREAVFYPDAIRSALKWYKETNQKCTKIFYSQAQFLHFCIINGLYGNQAD